MMAACCPAQLSELPFLSRYVFWVDCCEAPHIGRVGMDGKEQRVLIDKEIYSPTALTIDYTNKRIYWADDNHILFANMDGTQRRKGEARMSFVTQKTHRSICRSVLRRNHPFDCILCEEHSKVDQITLRPLSHWLLTWISI